MHVALGQLLDYSIILIFYADDFVLGHSLIATEDIHVKLPISKRGTSPGNNVENNKVKKKELPERIIGNFKSIMCSSLIMCGII